MKPHDIFEGGRFHEPGDLKQAFQPSLGGEMVGAGHEGFPNSS